MNKCKWFGHRFSKWVRREQKQIDTKTKVKTAAPIQERKCERCDFVERDYL